MWLSLGGKAMNHCKTSSTAVLAGFSLLFECASSQTDFQALAISFSVFVIYTFVRSIPARNERLYRRFQSEEPIKLKQKYPLFSKDCFTFG